MPNMVPFSVQGDRGVSGSTLGVGTLGEEPPPEQCEDLGRETRRIERDRDFPSDVTHDLPPHRNDGLSVEP
jgi:hypothetical protein